MLAWAALGGASFAAVAQSWRPGNRSGHDHRSNRVVAAVGDTLLLDATAAVAGLAFVGPAAAPASGWALGAGWWASIPLLGSGLLMYGALVLTGFWAANTSAAGARHAEMAPVLDRLLPLSAREVRLTRGVVPLLAAAVWMVTVLGLQAARTGEVLWPALALPWTLVLAVAALRSGYRPPPRSSRVPVASPMGSVPPAGGLFHGLDVALVGTLPTAITLYVGFVTSCSSRLSSSSPCSSASAGPRSSPASERARAAARAACRQVSSRADGVPRPGSAPRATSDKPSRSHNAP